MKKIKIAVIGSGLRGTYNYAKYIYENLNDCEIVSIVEPKKGRRDLFAKIYNIQENKVFDNIEDFLKKDKIVDAVIITSNDDMHFEHVSLVLEKGYDVLLETPLANTLDKLVKLKGLSKKHSDKVFMTCHLLRYSELFNKLKQIVENKELGEIISIEYSENIGYEDFAHSYTRGNWRIDSDKSPIILNKCCHDLDILSYIINSKIKKVASFGSLKHMNNKNFKSNMGENCFVCKVEENCPYSSKKIYLHKDRYINNAVHINPSKENLEKILKHGPYGRCVYKCDNNIVDNMVSILEFENGVTANFNLSAFTKENDKKIRLLFSHGEACGSILNNEIKIKKFNEIENKIIKLGCKNKSNLYKNEESKLIDEFLSLVKKEKNKENIVDEIIESNVVAFASEYSRISEEVVYVDDFYENAVYMTKEIENILF